MIDSVLALGVGTVFGLVLSLLKLPLPAPNVFAGVVAVFGAYLGGELYKIIAPMIGS